MSKSNTLKKRMSRRAGYSLIEVVTSSVLIGTLGVASLQTSTALVRSRREAAMDRSASLLCESYLTEVLQAKFGPKPTDITLTELSTPIDATVTAVGVSGTRSTFEYMEDFHNRKESPPTDRFGTTLRGYGPQWSVAISVVGVEPSLKTVVQSDSNDHSLKRVTVEISDPTGRTTTMTGLRSKNGIREHIPKATTQYVQWVGLDVKLENGTQILSGTTPLDRAKLVD